MWLSHSCPRQRRGGKIEGENLPAIRLKGVDGAAVRDAQNPHQIDGGFLLAAVSGNGDILAGVLVIQLDREKITVLLILVTGVELCPVLDIL